MLQRFGSLRASGIGIAQCLAADGGKHSPIMARPNAEMMEVVLQSGAYFTCSVLLRRSDVHSTAKGAHS
ncbi:hypothetical protein D3C86_1957800 [compost metagenome]